MDLTSLLEYLDSIDRRMDRLVERGFIVVAAGFGGWVVWSVADSTSAGLLMKVGLSLAGAAVSAFFMWVFWLIAKVLH